MDIEYLPAVDGSSMTARFDPPKTNIVHGHEAIEITELITFPVEMGLDPIEIGPSVLVVSPRYDCYRLHAAAKMEIVLFHFIFAACF